MIGNPLGAKGITAEAAIAKLCLEGLPALELFERAALPFRRAVPYSAGCWKPVDPRTLLWTGFGIEDGGTGTLAAARWRFIDNELLDSDYANSRYRGIHRSLGFGAELRAAFRDADACWGSVALVRDENQPDFSDREVAFVARISAHLAYGLRDALLREMAAAGVADHAPGVIILGRDGSVRSLTDQAKFWLERFPRDRGTTLELPAAVHAVANRVLERARSGPAVPLSASVRLTSGQWITVHGAALNSCGPDPDAVAVTLAPSTVAELEPIWSRYGWRCMA